MPLTLSDRGSLIIPVAHERLSIPAELEIDGERLVRKTEHHMTVLGYPAGKKIRPAVKAKPELGAVIQGLIDAADFEWRLTDRFYHLAQPNLRTVVVLVEAPGVAAFFAALAPHVEGLGPPPPAHITLFTSDPAGKNGIGLNNEAELLAAMERTDRAQLCARELPSSLLTIG